MNYIGSSNSLQLYDSGAVVLQSKNATNLLIMSNNAGSPLILGSYASGRKAAACCVPLSDTCMAIWAVEYNSIGTRVDLRLGHYSTNYGIFYDFSTLNVGIHNDSPSERLDVNGYIKSSSGYKVGSFEVIHSSGGVIIQSYTDFNNAPYDTFAKDATSGDVYWRDQWGWTKVVDR